MADEQTTTVQDNPVIEEKTILGSGASENQDWRSSLNDELKAMQSMPENISSEKSRLQNSIKKNKEMYDLIASKLRTTEQEANEVNKKLKLEEVRLNELREEKIRIEGIIETTKETMHQLTDQVRAVSYTHLTLPTIYSV